MHAQKFKNDSGRVKCSHRSDEKQLIISCLLSPFSPRWELIVNKDHESSRQKYSERHVYKVLPNQCGFCCLSGFFVIFLNFLLWNLPKFFTAYRTQRDVNFKHFFVFQIYAFNLCQKPGLKDFPGKRAPTKVQYLFTVCQILRYFAEGNARKITVSFAFCAHVDVIKYRKTLTFSFERGQIT